MTPAARPVDEVEQIARDSLELARKLDVDVAPFDEKWPLQALLLAHRARSLVAGVHQVAPIFPRMAALIIRPLIECGVVLRFLESNPALHVQLWMAESERQGLAMFSDIETNPAAAHVFVERAPKIVIKPAARAEKQRIVDEARAAASRAGLPFGQRGPLVPRLAGMIAMVDVAKRGDLILAYHIAYRSENLQQHVSAKSFEKTVWRHPDGEHRITDGGSTSWPQPRQTTLTAFSIFAYILEATSSICGLGIEQEADRLRDRIIALA